MQRALFLAGFDPGPIDGKAGPQTRRAAEKFCKRAGIAFTDYGDPVFLNALSNRLAKQLPFFA
jgi:peptidoglycan hydrolase-like protein with peptidoglycan-binding domain